MWVSASLRIFVTPRPQTLYPLVDMDAKYAFRYKVNTSDTARANSLTDRGTMEVNQSHWMVQAIPSMFAAQIAANAYGAALDVDYLDVEYMLSMSLLSSPWLDDQDIASWTTLAQYMGEVFQAADQAGYLPWGVTFKTIELATQALTLCIKKLPVELRTVTQQRIMPMPLPAHNPNVMGAGNAM